MKTILFCFLWFFNILNIGKTEKPPSFTKEEMVLFMSGTEKPKKELIEKLARERINASYFAMLRDTTAKNAPLNIKKYKKYFKEASDSFKIKIEIIEAVAFVESYGRWDAGSHVGAKGIMQLMPKTAREMGLRVGYYKQKIDGKIKDVYVDERLEPRKAIFAGAKYLSIYVRNFGQEDLGIANYHMGPGNMRNVLKLAKTSDVSTDWKSIYFSGIKNSDLGKFLNSLDDYSKSYIFGVWAAEELLAMSYQDYLGFYYKYQNTIKDDQRASYRFYSWLCPSDAYECVDHLREAYDDGFLFKIPQKGIGIFKTDSLGRLEKNFFNKENFYYARPELFGVLVLIDQAYKKAVLKNTEKLQILSLTEALECRNKYVFANELPVSCFGRSVVIKPPKDKLLFKKFDEVVYNLASIGWISRAKDEKGNFVIVVSLEEKPNSFFVNVWAEYSRNL